MASPSSFPLKSIILVVAVAFTAGVYRAQLQNLIVNAVTGPGSYSRIGAAMILLANLKILPGVWHVCATLSSILSLCLLPLCSS